MSEPFETSYMMSAEESEITAKWQLGVRNLSQPLALALLGAVALIEVARRTSFLPAPGWTFLAADAVAVMLFVGCIYLLDKKVKACAGAIAKRRLNISVSDERLNVAEGGRSVYSCDIGEITRVEAGPRVARITSPAGAICVPLRALPEGFAAAQRERLGKQGFKIYNWM